MFKKFNLLVTFAILLISASGCTKKDSSNTVKDIDGNVYHTVKIGSQTWMVENLKTTKYNDGTDIPIVSDGTTWSNLTTPGYCFYNNDVANKNRYGALYNWFTVNTGKLAPTGWHIPTVSDWTQLENCLMENGYNYDSTTIGNKIAKALAATTDWYNYTGIGTIGNDISKNNISGFAGLPGGYRNNDGTFYNIGCSGNWWSSTEFNLVGTNAWSSSLNFNKCNVNRYFYNGQYGYSVRCIRDF